MSAEFEILQDDVANYQQQVDRSNGPLPELVEVAANLFGSNYDPSHDKAKLTEVLGFAMESGVADGPDKLMNFMGEMDRRSTPDMRKYPLLDRVWLLVQRAKIAQAQRKLSGGP